MKNASLETRDGMTRRLGVLLPLLLLLASVARDEAEKCGVHRDKLLTIRRWAGL